MKQRLENIRTAVMNDSQSATLGSRATRSGVWIGGGFVIQRGLQFASNLILTRLLFPEAFGLMALATVFLIGLAMFSDIGIKPSVIRDPRGNEPTFLNTAWTIQVIRGFGLFIGGCLLAYPISLIYEQPIMFPLLAVLSSTAAIAGFNSIKAITAERDLDFKSVTFIQIAGQVISIFLMVALAFYFRSVWSLAAANVLGSLASLALSHIVLRGHTHRFTLNADIVKSIVHFGKWVFLSTVATYLGGEGLRAIQGGLISPAEFGVLTIAYTIAAIPTDISLRLTALMAMPVVAETHRVNAGKAFEILNKFRKRTLSISLLLFVFFAIFAQYIIQILYDSRYHDAGEYLGPLAISNWLSVISAGYLSAILSMGESRTYFFIISLQAIFRIILTIFGYYQFEIIGMIIGIGIANLLSFGIISIATSRIGMLNLKMDLIFLFFASILVTTMAYT